MKPSLCYFVSLQVNMEYSHHNWRGTVNLFPLIIIKETHFIPVWHPISGPSSEFLTHGLRLLLAKLFVTNNRGHILNIFHSIWSSFIRLWGNLSITHVKKKKKKRSLYCCKWWHKVEETLVFRAGTQEPWRHWKAVPTLLMLSTHIVIEGSCSGIHDFLGFLHYA